VQRVDLLSIFGVALALAMDALAVSVAVGLRLAHVTARHTFRVSFHFGFFQFLMPVVGWLGGAQFASAIAGWDHWLVFALLGVLGGKMIWQALTGKVDSLTDDPTRGWSLVSLSVATSLDALAIGVSLAFLGESIWLAAVIIGLVAGILSLIGIRAGNRLGRHFSQWAEIAGGCVLLLVGLRILLTHLKFL